MTPEVPKSLLQHQKPRDKQQKATTKTEQTIWPDQEGDDSDADDDGLLKRKTFSALQPELKARAEASGKKLLEVASDSEDEDEKSSSDENDVEEQPSSTGDATKKAKPALTRVQLAKRELKRNIRSHSKIEFDESGNVSFQVTRVCIFCSLSR